MEKRGKRGEKMDYDKIFELYNIRRTNLSENKLRARRNDLSRKLKKYLERKGLSGTSWFDLPGYLQDDFICYEIKDKMLKKLSPDEQKVITKKLDNYVRNSLAQGARLRGNRNEAITESFYKRDYVKEGASDKEIDEAYQELCENWVAFHGDQLKPPTKYEFQKNPNRSVYDYTMSNTDDSNELESDLHDIVLSILVKVLEEKVGLKIDYDGIKECLWELHRLDREKVGIDLSIFEFERFPETFEEYWKEVSQGSEENKLEKEEAKQIYDKASKTIMKMSMVQQCLRTLSNFYSYTK